MPKRRPDPWPRIVARLAPELAGLPPPKNYFIGRCCGRPAVPDNILVFLRRDLAGSPSPVMHHRHVLILALAGCGRVSVDLQVHTLRPGQALLILPHQVHHYVDVQPPLCWIYAAFEQDPRSWSRLHDRLIPMQADQEGLILRLLRTFSDPRPEAAERLTLTLTLLLEELADAAASISPSTQSSAVGANRLDLLGQVNRLVYSNLHKPLGIRGIAAEMGVSASQLRHILRLVLGMSLGQYILRSRINQARIMLRDPGLRIVDIARRTGFASLQSFSRAFHRMTGESPRATRLGLLGGTGRAVTSPAPGRARSAR